MSILRKYLVIGLREKYDNVKCTYGYITKYTRIKNHLEKDHNIDARCISGNPLAKPNGKVYIVKKVRCHNRQLHKFKTSKGGIERLIKHLILYMVIDCLTLLILMVKYVLFIVEAQMDLSLLKILMEIQFPKVLLKKKLKLVEKRKGWIFDVRKS